MIIVELSTPKRAVIQVGKGWFDRIASDQHSFRLKIIWNMSALGMQVLRECGSKASHSPVKDPKEIISQ